MKALAAERRDHEEKRLRAGSDLGEPGVLLRALGPIAVTDRGHDLPLPRGRTAALLAWLVAHRASGVSVAESVSALWPHLDQAGGARELRRHLAMLRQQLARVHAMIIRRGTDLELVLPAAAVVDVDLFEGRLAAAQNAVARGAQRPALGLVRQALALWRSDNPFVEIRETPVGSDECVRLGRLRLRALDLRDGLRLRLDRDSRLLTDLEAKVTADPAHEVGWRQLMVALNEAGHRVEALRAFQACRQSLQLLGLAPCVETRLVEAALLVGRAPDPDLYMPQPGTEGRRRVEEPRTSPGVGVSHADELASVSLPGSVLEALIDDAWVRPSRAWLAVLIGERGTAGKLADIARQRGGEVVVVPASEPADGRSVLRSVRDSVPSALIVDCADQAHAGLLGAVGDLRRGPGPVLIALVTRPGGVGHLSELILHADCVLEHVDR